MLLQACELGKVKLALLEGQRPDAAAVRALAQDLGEIIAEHRDLWLARNRIGGLEEMSLPPLRRIAAAYRELL